MISTPHTNPLAQTAGVTFAKTFFPRLPHSNHYNPHRENTLAGLILVNTEYKLAHANPKNTSAHPPYSRPRSGSR
jgi:hypothetical protein